MFFLIRNLYFIFEKTESRRQPFSKGNRTFNKERGKRRYLGAMIKNLTTKPNDLGLSPRTYMVEGESRFPQDDLHTHTYTKNINKEINK